jgi:predicted nucleic acid-binding protein
MGTKAVIDTGTMITLSGTCLMNVFKNFVRANKIDLMISNTIAQESVWNPINNKKFALNAARIKYAISEQIVKTVPKDSQISFEMEKILKIANHIYFTQHGPLTIIQAGEAEALALAKIYNSKAMFIDERTTRSLIENPLRLKQVLERRQEETVKINQENLDAIKGMFPTLKMFRSVDIIALAFEQDLFDHELAHGKLELEAALWAAKFNGCAVSENEINEYLSNAKDRK